MDHVTPERWLPVPTWEGYYEVSDHGFVRSLPRFVNGRGGSRRLIPGRILKPSYTNTGGYPMVNLSLGDRKEGRYVHDLVMRAHVGEPSEGQEVRHLDRDERNAALRDAAGVQRLIYGTSGENKHDQVRHGTHPEGSRTHCDADHELTEDNTRIDYYPDGTFMARRCKTCDRDRSARQRAKRQNDERHCKEDGCGKPYFGRGWCSMHYVQWQKEQPGGREKIAARQAVWYEERKQSGNPAWVPSADLPPEKLERRRALARERMRRYNARKRQERDGG
jgi:NUMOD4 motif-containing protein